MNNMTPAKSDPQDIIVRFWRPFLKDLSKKLDLPVKLIPSTREDLLQFQVGDRVTLQVRDFQELFQMFNICNQQVRIHYDQSKLEDFMGIPND